VKHISISQRTLQKHRVQLLRREALRLHTHTFKEKDEWLTAKVMACNGNEEALEDLRELLRVMPFSVFMPASVDAIRHSREKLEKLGKAFDAIETIGQRIQRAKAKWPLRVYCEQVIGLSFDQQRKCKCPLHVGHSGNRQFVIDEQTNKWFCFGNCPPDPGKDYRSGDVIDLHRIVKDLRSQKEAVEDLLAIDRTATLPSSYKPKPSLLETVKAAKDEQLIATALRRCADVTRESIAMREPATAADFAKYLLQTQERLVVARTKYAALIGQRAVRALRRAPERLQYLCCSTAKTEQQHKQSKNLHVERPLFLNVEFDQESPDNQLRILWWLKTVRKWRLVSITFSGGKSWHGLFAVRAIEAARLAQMRTLAMRLGACRRSLQPTQWVRFPGGVRTLEDWQQTPVAQQEILYFDPVNTVLTARREKKVLVSRWKVVGLEEVAFEDKERWADPGVEHHRSPGWNIQMKIKHQLRATVNSTARWRLSHPNQAAIP
jgi:hypothetical protein